MEDRANNLDDEYIEFISRIRKKVNEQDTGEEAKNQANILVDGVEKYIIRKWRTRMGLIDFDRYIQVHRFANREQAIENAVNNQVDTLDYVKRYLRARNKKLTDDNVSRALTLMMGVGDENELEDEDGAKRSKKHTRHRRSRHRRSRQRRSRHRRSRHRRSRHRRSRHNKRKHKKSKQR